MKRHRHGAGAGLVGQPRARATTRWPRRCRSGSSWRWRRRASSPCRRDVPGVPADRSNLCVRAFEVLHPADGLSFQIRSEIPPAAGLGSSAAAIVAGLSRGRPHVRARRAAVRARRASWRATPTTSPPRCSAASWSAPATSPVRFDPPPGLEGVLAIPPDPVPTAEARAALPAEVPMADAVHNVAHASLLVLGLAQRRLLADRPRPVRPAAPGPPRAHLYPRSMELLEPRRGARRRGRHDLRRRARPCCSGAHWQQTGNLPGRAEARGAGLRRAPRAVRARRRRREGDASDGSRPRAGWWCATARRHRGAAWCTARATTTGRCPRASSTRARASRRPRCARWRRRPACAARSGASCRDASTATTRTGPKVVRYWQMEVDEDPGFEPNDEVDELRWLPTGRGGGAAHLRARPAGCCAGLGCSGGEHRCESADRRERSHGGLTRDR